MQRRSKETGRWVTVDRYRQGDRVRARCYFRRANGEPGEVCRFALTKVAAALAIEEFFATSEATADHLSRGMAVADAGSVWLREIERVDSNLSSATLTAYRGALDRYVRAEGSAIGQLTLGQLTTANLRAFLQGVADGHGTGTAKMVKSVLSGVLGLAMTDGVLAANPLLGIRAVRQDGAKARDNARDHQRAFTRAERDEVLEALYERAGLPALPRTMNTRRTTADLVAFMAGTGHAGRRWAGPGSCSSVRTPSQPGRSRGTEPTPVRLCALHLTTRAPRGPCPILSGAQSQRCCTRRGSRSCISRTNSDMPIRR